MKICIVTLPLKNNYGGILQNYALQEVLREMGHEVYTIDYIPKPKFYRILLSHLRTILYLFVPSKRRAFVNYSDKIKPQYNGFISKNIKRTYRINHYTNRVLIDYKPDAIIVGSDQVWRLLYNKEVLADMFLDFATNYNCSKIAYAASFGINQWDYDDEQTEKIKCLIKNIPHISVRELSGVKICKEILGVEAREVLDPTMLLSSEKYSKLCERIPNLPKKYIGAYILDENEETLNELNRICLDNSNYPLEIHHAGEYSKLTVGQWLYLIKNAEILVTDSFHGYVFSQMFNTKVHLIINTKRGSERFYDIQNKLKRNDIQYWKRISLEFLESCLK